MQKRVMLAFGTRPEAIKMAPVYHALKADGDAFDTLCCVTGQHRQMLDQVLTSFAIAPDIDLDLMRAGQSLDATHAAVVSAMGQVLRDARPDVLLVHGDTTTTMASALAAFYAGIPVGHVEAGLRSHDLAAPYPEELNRRVTDMIAHFHFAPTEDARDNLLRENCDAGSIVVTGNTVIDAVALIQNRLADDPKHLGRVAARLDAQLGFAWRSERFVLVTCHRRENIGARLADICAALTDLATAFPAIRFLFPLHPNPRVRDQVGALLPLAANLHLCEPLAYEDFLHILQHCHCVLTDSGGLQEEAPALGKPVLVMRDVTERPEAVATGAARLVGASRAGIVRSVSRLLGDDQAHAAMATAPNPYGDGQAAKHIATFLKAI